VSAARILPGSYLSIGRPPEEEQAMTAQGVSGDRVETGEGEFYREYPVGVPVRLVRPTIVRASTDGRATLVSRFLESLENTVRVVAAAPDDVRFLYALTGLGRVLYMERSDTASGTTDWPEASTGRPAGDHAIAALTAAPRGRAFVLFAQPVADGGTTTPLYRIEGGRWFAEPCEGVPRATGPDGSVVQFGRMVADPVQPDNLYAVHASSVYRVRFVAADRVWRWEDLGAGLPGVPVSALSAVDVGGGKVVLRAATFGRGIWETEVTLGVTQPEVSLYLRANLLDGGWHPRCPEGVSNPLQPTAQVWHYQCADVKVDAPQRVGGASDFFQVDRTAGVLSNVEFDQLRHSSDVPGGATAVLHVQVHNRGARPSGPVWVWAITCEASAVVPSLSTSPRMANRFPFWSQFGPSGIVPALPEDSPWESIGVATLDDIDPAHPRVGTLTWRTPSVPAGTRRHQCIAVFVHGSGAGALRTMETNLDVLAATNRQVGQKNVHVIGSAVRAQPPESDFGAPGPAATGMMRESIRFHNPTGEIRVADLVFDLRNFRASVPLEVEFGEVDSVEQLAQSLEGLGLERGPRWPDWLRGIGRRLRKKPGSQSLRGSVKPGSVGAVRGVRLQPFGSCATELSLDLNGVWPGEVDTSFEVQQRVKGEIAGGSTFTFPSRPKKGEGLRNQAPPALGYDVGSREVVESAFERRSTLERKDQ
jgi:hypothetical protein